jgi:hypothetical protein
MDLLNNPYFVGGLFILMPVCMMIKFGFMTYRYMKGDNYGTNR